MCTESDKDAVTSRLVPLPPPFGILFGLALTLAGLALRRFAEAQRVGQAVVSTKPRASNDECLLAAAPGPSADVT
jgi:hypothetical protein